MERKTKTRCCVKSITKSQKPKKITNKKLNCAYCNFSCTEFEILKDHIKECMKCKYCKSCSIHFKTSIDYLIHLVNEHNKSGEFNCNRCKFSCRKIKTLEQHLLQKHDDKLNNNKFICNYCNIKLKYKSNLKLHIIKNHLNQGIIVTEQSTVQKTNPSTNKTHTRRNRVKFTETIYACQNCIGNKIFSSISKLKSHILQHKTTTFVCSVCNLIFETQKKLCDHYKLHKILEPYYCITCNCTFNTNLELNIHANEYNTHFISAIKCEFCPITKTTKKDYDAHYQTCKEIHIKKQQLNLKNTTVKRMLPYSNDIKRCSICGIGFKELEELRDHVQNHMLRDIKGSFLVRKGFSCNFCEFKLDFVKDHSVYLIKNHIMKCNLQHEESIVENQEMEGDEEKLLEILYPKIEIEEESLEPASEEENPSSNVDPDRNVENSDGEGNWCLTDLGEPSTSCDPLSDTIKQEPEEYSE